MRENFLEYLNDEWEDLLELGIEHFTVVVVAVAIATVLGVGVGIATYRTERPRDIALGIAGTFLTIPSLALFGLFVAIPGIGYGPTGVVIALVMYALLPIVRNTIVGLREVDPAIVESAQGMGMGRVRRLLRIELPLAWPVIVTGMRVSTVLTVGIAAIGAFVEGPGLGNDIFKGIDRIGVPETALNLILGGLLGVIVLAVLFDLLYVLLLRLTTSRGIR